MIKQPSGSKAPRLNSTFPSASNNKQVRLGISWTTQACSTTKAIVLRPCRRLLRLFLLRRCHTNFFSMVSSSLVAVTPISLISVRIFTTNPNSNRLISRNRRPPPPPPLLRLLLPPRISTTLHRARPASIILTMGKTSILVTTHQVSSSIFIKSIKVRG